MAGRGGAQAPDYAPRPAAGPGALANRQDMTRGTGAQLGQTALTGAPTPPATGTGGAYGQRQELQQLQAGAPAAGRHGPGRPPAPPSPSGGLAAGAEEEPEPALPPLALMPEGVNAVYTPADIRDLEGLLPVLHLMASQPDATPAVQELFNLAGEVVLNNQAANRPVPGLVGPAPELQGEEL